MQTEKSIERSRAINNLVGIIGDCLGEIRALYIETVAESKDDPRSLQVDEAISALAAVGDIRSRLFHMKSVYCLIDTHSPMPRNTRRTAKMKGAKK